MNKGNSHQNQLNNQQLKAAGNAFEQLKAQRTQFINQNLDAVKREQDEEAQMLITIVQAAIHQGGVPNDSYKVDQMALHCEQLTERIINAKRRREWNQIVVELERVNARNPDPLMVAAAQRAGVELVKPAIVPDAPKLVTE